MNKDCQQNEKTNKPELVILCEQYSFRVTTQLCRIPYEGIPLLTMPKCRCKSLDAYLEGTWSKSCRVTGYHKVSLNTSRKILKHATTASFHILTYLQFITTFPFPSDLRSIITKFETASLNNNNKPQTFLAIA